MIFIRRLVVMLFTIDLQFKTSATPLANLFFRVKYYYSLVTFYRNY